MIRRPPRSTRTDTLFPYPTLFRSDVLHVGDRSAGRLRDRDQPRHAAALAAPAAAGGIADDLRHQAGDGIVGAADARSEEHTSELQSLMRISYAVFCLKKKTK